MITYCHGRGKTDAYPKLREAQDFESFTKDILELPRARTKAARTYICGPLRPNGGIELHRCKEDLLPRWWLGLDLDGGSRADVDLLLMRLPAYQAVAWQTARSAPECPRWRIVVLLNREVDRSEGKRLGAALVAVLGAGLDSLHWDHSTHLGEQMCYLPMERAEVVRHRGEPIDVDAMLAKAPEPSRESIGSADGPILEGSRDKFLTSLAGSMRRRGMSKAGIYAALTEENRSRCVPPLPDIDVRRIARSVSRYEPEPAREEPPVESYEEDARRHRGSASGNGAEGSGHGGNGAGETEKATAGPQIIEVRAGELPRIVKDAIKALRGAAVPVYDRGGALYRPVRIENPPKDDDHIRRPVGAVTLRPVDSSWARFRLAGAAQWQKWDARDKKLRPTDPPKDIAEIVATQSDIGNWPVLRGVVRRIRVMGGHTVVTVPCVSMVTATGNNLVLRGDVVRRGRLDAQTERPELRDFDQDLLAEVREYRRHLVADIICIMLAYQLASATDGRVPRLGGYEAWSRMVRQALCWVGEVDPCRSMERTRGVDPLRLDLSVVLEAWHSAFGKDPVTAAEAVGRAEEDAKLREALACVCEKRGVLDSRGLGNWLRAHRDRRLGKLVLRSGQNDGHRKVARWMVLES